MSREGDGCECCGRPGRLVGAGSDARIRCGRHEYVIDAGNWLRVRSEMTCAFTSEGELTAYFRRDYGAGLEMIQELQSDGSEDSSDADETQH